MGSMTEEVSLRPMSLRPGGQKAINPFAAFGRGAGAGLVTKVAEPGPQKEVVRKRPEDIVRYTRDFLMKFNDTHLTKPEGLAGPAELLIEEAGALPSSAAAAAEKAALASTTDGRDWRGRTALPAPAEGASGRQWDQGAAPAKAAGGQEGPQAPPRPMANGARADAAAAAAPAGGLAPIAMERAQDVGKQAWQPRTAASAGAAGSSGDQERAVRAVKGVLNKLTPEKFDRLLTQLLDQVTSAAILQATISLIFENAVAQPTFVSMYAGLCDSLSKALPEFPAADGGKPLKFTRVLLNTCQEEFEGVAAARTRAASLPAEEQPAALRATKLRTLGNIRLIGELYKQDVLPERILLEVVKLLLGDGKAEPHEDDVEALCELLSIAGAKLDASPSARPHLDKAFAALQRLQKTSKTLSVRVRFRIRDAMELRSSNWVARRTEEKAQKLSEIRAAAHAELGMVAPTTTLALPTLALLPALPALPTPGGGRGDTDAELFPALKGQYEDVAAGGAGARDPQASSLVGEYVPVPLAPVPAPEEEAAAAAEAAEPEPEAAPEEEAKPAAPAKSEEELEEERLSQAKSLYSDYLATGNMAEAVGTARGLQGPGFTPKLVAVGMDKMFESMAAKEQDAVRELLIALLRRRIISTDDFVAGLGETTNALEDLALDIPSAPEQTSKLAGLCVGEGVLPVARFRSLYGGVAFMEDRRKYVAAALKFAKAKVGPERLEKLCADQPLGVEEFLAAPPEDGLPDVKAFLKDNALTFVR